MREAATGSRPHGAGSLHIVLCLNYSFGSLRTGPLPIPTTRRVELLSGRDGKRAGAEPMTIGRAYSLTGQTCLLRITASAAWHRGAAVAWKTLAADTKRAGAWLRPDWYPEVCPDYFTTTSTRRAPALSEVVSVDSAGLTRATDASAMPEVTSAALTACARFFDSSAFNATLPVLSL